MHYAGEDVLPNYYNGSICFDHFEGGMFFRSPTVCSILWVISASTTLPRRFIWIPCPLICPFKMWRGLYLSLRGLGWFLGVRIWRRDCASLPHFETCTGGTSEGWWRSHDAFLAPAVDVNRLLGLMDKTIFEDERNYRNTVEWLMMMGAYQLISRLMLLMTWMIYSCRRPFEKLVVVLPLQPVIDW